MSLTLKPTTIFLSLMMAFILLAPAALAADPVTGTGVDKALDGLKATGEKGLTSTDAKLYPAGGLSQIIGQVVGAVLAFVGVIFFLLILWAGFGWMLAKGNEEKIIEAKETIFSAVLGLIVIMGAYAITRLIADIFSKI